MNKMIKSKRVKKLVVSLLLAISLLSCSFSVYAVEGTAPPVGDNWLLVSNDETAAFLVWQLLQSWGIDIQYQNISQWTGDVQDLIQNWIYDFLGDQPSIESVGAWIADWLFGTDFWGNLVVNQTLLEDVQDFADWLVDKYDLTDNSTEIIDPVYTASGYTFYQTDTWYNAILANGEIPDNVRAFNFITTQGNVSGYIIVRNTEYEFNQSSGWGVVALSNINPNGTTYLKRTYSLSDGTQQSTTTLSFSSFTLSSQGWYYRWRQGALTPDYGTDQTAIVKPYGSYFEGTGQEIVNFLNNITVVTQGDIKFVISIINLPDTDPAYTPGDSLTIIDGQPDYSEVDWDGTVTVGNLPAIISTGSLENPEIDQIFTNIPPLVEEAGNSMEIFRQIIFRMPDGVLIALYALLSAGVIFGLLRIMREH